MDRFGPRLTILTLGAVVALAGAAPPSADLPIRSAQWLDPSQRLQALSSQPLECAAIPRAPGERKLFEIGRAAFRAPLLLGGQAARSGLSCASCHSNGRRNQAFLFPSLSGEPGTADVTSSLMSAHRGNGVFDPKPIPDLAVPDKVSRRPGDPALETFIRGLIVEEFDGAEPPALILQGLGTYVRAIGRPGCDLQGHVPLRLATMTGDAARAVDASAQAWRGGDIAAARLLLSSARSTLGLIDERYDTASLVKDRQAIRRADRALLAIGQAIDRRATDVATRLAAWRADMPRWTARLVRDQAQSLFSPARLAHMLGGAVPNPHSAPARDAGSLRR